ncbi:MAG: NAD(+)/NADH kinase [Methanomicrobiales archaeon]|nr:NAD(+)/NADH kinase [Methanomicrobiales archaeon]
MRVGYISRIDDRKAVDYTRKLREDLEAEGFITSYDHIAHLSSRERPRQLDIDADLMVVVGGDGTVLRTVQLLKKQIPIIGINWGEVGFLTDLEPEEAPAFFRSIREGFPVEKRMRIAISVGGEYLASALNEAVIITSRPAKMLRFSLIVDGVAVGTVRADGLLVSTPTGSTAYAMSAGGPIVDPCIEGFLIVPLAPYMLSSRPWLMSYERSLEVRLENTKPAKLVIDGQKTWELHERTYLTVQRSSEPALFVDVGKKFFEKVENKLRCL